jgi:phage shock protein A
MTSFFKKLNTLISSQINDVIRPLTTDDGEDTPKKRAARQAVGKSLAQDVAALRKRIEEAQDYEATLQKRVDKLYADVARWDEVADRAVNDGREGEARYAVTRLQQAQRDLQQTEDALREHQQVTQELISRVNYMEYVVNQAQEQEAQAPEQEAPPPVRRTSIPVSVASDDEADEAPADLSQARSRLAKPAASSPAQNPAPQPRQERKPASEQGETPAASQQNPAPQKKPRSQMAQKANEEYAEGVELARQIGEKLDATREKLAELVSQNTPLDPQRDVMEEVKKEIDQQLVDDDLARRLARLSKPEKKP